MTKKKIAILGAGMASLSAAYELTDYENWQNDYEVTIYDLGWRLGGKTHTGRGVNNRIEEHGIHILQGWYATTFRMLRAVYAERKEKGLAPDSPLQDLFEDGLTRNNTTILTDFDPELGKWTNWPLIFPETENLPGGLKPPSIEEQIRKAVALLLEIILGSPYQAGENPISKWILDHFFPTYGPHGKEGCLGALLKPIIGKAIQDEFAHLPPEYKSLLEAHHLANDTKTVSYTHLTLPTICSV